LLIFLILHRIRNADPPRENCGDLLPLISVPRTLSCKPIHLRPTVSHCGPAAMR
jgi:hypothetical protein